MQLNVFDDLINNKANELLDLLNEDKKEKHRYYPQYTTQIGNRILLIACNSEKDLLFNVIDVLGEIPKELSVNWRNLEHIKNEKTL